MQVEQPIMPFIYVTVQHLFTHTLYFNTMRNNKIDTERKRKRKGEKKEEFRRKDRRER